MTPTHIPALRLALRSMLADVMYTGIPMDRREWAANWLEVMEWKAAPTDELRTYALDWIRTQRVDVQVAMRQALGEKVSEEEAAMRPSEARLGRTHSRITTTLEGVAMDTIPAPTEQHKRTVEVPKDSAVTELFGDDTETRLVQIEEEMRREPYWFPHDQERLAKAIKAVRDGKVARDRFGIYHVTGSKPSDIYDCDKECPCPQGQKGKSKWCYHLIATVVYRKLHAELPTDPPLLFPAPKSVDERLAEPGTDAFIPEPDDIPDPPPRPATVPASVSAVPHVQYVTHAGAVMYEAPYSATVSVEDEDGYHLLLTVRKQDGKEFYKAIDGLRAWCKQHNLHPQHRRTQASGTAAPTVPASPAVPSAVEPPACLYHGTMKPSPKVPGTYFCPKKLADGTYCTERWPKKAAA